MLNCNVLAWQPLLLSIKAAAIQEPAWALHSLLHPVLWADLSSLLCCLLLYSRKPAQVMARTVVHAAALHAWISACYI